MVKNFGHPVKVAVQKYTFYRIGLYETGLILYVPVRIALLGKLRV